MGSGGKRDGAGRKKGSKTQITALREKAMKEGEMPHEFLLRVARGEYITHGEEEILPDFKLRIRCAEMAAQFFAPKLATIEQKIEQETHHVISASPLTPEQFEQKYIEVDAESEHSLGTATTPSDLN